MLREEGDNVVVCAEGYKIVQKYDDTSNEQDEQLSKYVKQLQKMVEKKKHEVENRARFDYEWVVIKLSQGWLLLNFLMWLFS
jgi:translation initiation factor 2B subunit (eIF-2B alpha/beta/delta family)